MTTWEIETLARQLMAEYLPPVWRFKWDNARKRAGLCDYMTKTISLSRPIFSLPGHQHEARNTILHEIAHAIVGPGHHHDYMWQNQAWAIGCTGTRCHSLDVRPLAKYLGSCACGLDKHPRSKRPQGHYTCRRCRKGIDWRQVR